MIWNTAHAYTYNHCTYLYIIYDMKVVRCCIHMCSVLRSREAHPVASNLARLHIYKHAMGDAFLADTSLHHCTLLKNAGMPRSLALHGAYQRIDAYLCYGIVHQVKCGVHLELRAFDSECHDATATTCTHPASYQQGHG